MLAATAHHPQFIRLLLEAAELHSSWVPVLQDEGFRFPSKDVLDDLRSSGQHLLNAACRPDSTDALAFVVESCFKEIAVVFEPQKYSSTMLFCDHPHRFMMLTCFVIERRFKTIAAMLGL